MTAANQLPTASVAEIGGDISAHAFVGADNRIDVPEGSRVRPTAPDQTALLRRIMPPDSRRRVPQLNPIEPGAVTEAS